MVARELLGRVPPRGDGDRARTDRLSALDVRRRIADHEDLVARNLEAKILPRPALRERRKLAPRMMIRSEGTHAKAVDLDAGRLQLDRGALSQIPREASEYDITARLELVEELA